MIYLYISTSDQSESNIMHFFTMEKCEGIFLSITKTFWNHPKKFLHFRNPKTLILFDAKIWFVSSLHLFLRISFPIVNIVEILTHFLNWLGENSLKAGPNYRAVIDKTELKPQGKETKWKLNPIKHHTDVKITQTMVRVKWLSVIRETSFLIHCIYSAQ